MKLLFICVENTCRSQMAEGFAKHQGLNAMSAGLRAGTGVNHLASKVMDEIGIDISTQSSKSIADLEKSEQIENFDYIISLCEADAQNVCPSVSVNPSQALNWNLKDPSNGKGEIEEYRKTRDLIDHKLKQLISELQKQN